MNDRLKSSSHSCAYIHLIWLHALSLHKSFIYECSLKIYRGYELKGILSVIVGEVSESTGINIADLQLYTIGYYY